MLTPAGFRALPLAASQLSLAAVLKCGQSFRWTSYALPQLERHPSHEYRFVLSDRVICLRQSETQLFYKAVFPEAAFDASENEQRDATTLHWLNDYFQLDVDLVKLYETWSEMDPIFKSTVRERFPGIRILRQDPWENLIS